MEIHQTPFKYLRHDIQLVNTLIKRGNNLLNHQIRDLHIQPSPIKQRIDDILDITMLARSKSSNYGQDLDDQTNNIIKQTKQNLKYQQNLDQCINIMHQSQRKSYEAEKKSVQKSILQKDLKQDQPILFNKLSAILCPQDFQILLSNYLETGQISADSLNLFFQKQGIQRSVDDYLNISDVPKKRSKSNTKQQSYTYQLPCDPTLSDAHKVFGVPLRITRRAKSKQSIYAQKYVETHKSPQNLDQGIQFRMFSKAKMVAYTAELDHYLLQQIAKSK
ncbi:hypothetical protein SS50377_23920 [Spironucleus salmonicida]|uniref:Uncharacterized protein n=1 Tax=Spironucleus salmonicida TaxID=348837 RepID=V6M4N9_9EUKA|nr:hypothetical protein SS50377_23920 [Spironucleus salmonicida]|eukprot:EST48314.1 Hypothetical protein SS50377_11516 [Spironucleus salmonicida]